MRLACEDCGNWGVMYMCDLCGNNFCQDCMGWLDLCIDCEEGEGYEEDDDED